MAIRFEKAKEGTLTGRDGAISKTWSFFHRFFMSQFFHVIFGAEKNIITILVANYTPLRLVTAKWLFRGILAKIPLIRFSKQICEKA